MRCRLDFSDDDAKVEKPQGQKNNRFGLPHAVPVKSSLERRFEQMEIERDQARAQADAENNRFETFKVENDQKIDRMMANMEALQNTILANQNESNKKFQDMQDSSQRQFAKMLQMFDKMEKNRRADQQQTVHGKGSEKGAPSKTQVDDVTADDGEDEAGPNKKLKVPFRKGEDPDAASASENL